MKTTLILYGSDKKYDSSYRMVTGSGQPLYFVRAETHPGDLADALAAAKPRPGETVLNTVEAERTVSRPVSCPNCRP